MARRAQRVHVQELPRLRPVPVRLREGLLMEYVAGFMFSFDKKKVALILKNRPQWQKGRKNGIGGHVESGETPDEAMVREFEEETGVRHVPWNQFCTLVGPWGFVYFYRATGTLGRLKTMTDESICICKARYLHGSNVVPNLNWLIPMALSKDVWSSTVQWQDEEAPEGGW